MGWPLGSMGSEKLPALGASHPHARTPAERGRPDIKAVAPQLNKGQEPRLCSLETIPRPRPDPKQDRDHGQLAKGLRVQRHGNGAAWTQ